MPSYKVIAPGFHGGQYYHPEGKRQVLHTDKPFPKKKLPSWLGPMPKESEAVRKKREAQEASQADVEQSTEDQVNLASTEGDGAEASFMGKVINKMVPDDVVETL